jgi:hypothetical protein
MRMNRMFGSLVLAGSLSLLCLCIPAGSSAVPRVGVVVSVRVSPPVLPVYAQPICPGAGYIWEPGYWAYGDEGYYWVPGTWVLPPSAGLLWTPGYWGFSDAFYVWHVGYWGPTVGFYGGINYGFGYPGRGFYGGYWRGGQYFYNSRVTNVNRVVVHNVYSREFANERAANRISFNGGAHGIQGRPTAAELSAVHERHIAMTSAQREHEQGARANRTLLASVNHGRPEVTAVARPAALSNRREGANESRNEARHESGNNRVANTERAAVKSPRPSAEPERAPVHKTAPATRPAAATRTASARSERPSASEKPSAHPSAHRPEPTHNSPTPAPSHPANAPAHHAAAPTPKPAVTHTEKPAVHQSVHQQAQHQQTPRPVARTSPHEQSPSNSHPSQQHAAASHAAAPHPATNEQSHTNSNKPEH